MPRPPHKLTLYRHAVQHPESECAFAQRVHGRNPTLLKEDFAGSAALAAAWIQLNPQRQAWAVERHAPTFRFAQRSVAEQLGRAADRCHLVHADVLEVTRPRVDVIVALNFSVFIHHDRASLGRYFASARGSLRRGGVLIVDAYGGPGAMRPMLQRRAVPATHETPAFEYQWEQRRYDAATARVDNRIHFRIGQRVIRNAFRYDWRLWSLPELCELMREAGFADAAIWCDRYDAKKGRSDGVYRPTRSMSNREDWVAYVVGSV